MKRIIVICEGQTEQTFCNDVLQPYFNVKGIDLQATLIKKSKGGIVNWEALKHQIEKHLKSDQSVFLTTLIDFYGIHSHHKYPNWEKATNEIDKNKAMQSMEDGMKADVAEILQNRFIPYIQLHEFEALLFCEIEVFERNFEINEFKDFAYLQKTIEEFQNPEMINNGIETAPSKRLEKILISYNKIIYGSLIAQEIGLIKIKEKCPRFKAWIEQLARL
jgi:Domain of unknown function (DUF4276)